MVRIIAGEARGRKLKTPKGQVTRSTSNRVREALFNIIGARITGSTFLDVFAGSGAIGLEALSRGAKEAVFIEKNRRALECLSANILMTGFQEKSKIIPKDARKAVQDLIKINSLFDLIFIDPPYRGNWAGIILPEIRFLCVPSAMVIFETGREETIPQIKGLELISRRIYGDTALHIYQRVGGLLSGN